VSFAVIVLLSFVVQRQRIDGNNQAEKTRLFTVDELRTFTKDELYLAVLGKKKEMFTFYNMYKYSY
jgi:hypothetical protein